MEHIHLGYALKELIARCQQLKAWIAKGMAADRQMAEGCSLKERNGKAVGRYSRFVLYRPYFLGSERIALVYEGAASPYQPLDSPSLQ